MPPFLPANKLQFYCWKSRQILQQQNNFKRDGFERIQLQKNGAVTFENYYITYNSRKAPPFQFKFYFKLFSFVEFVFEYLR